MGKVLIAIVIIVLVAMWAAMNLSQLVYGMIQSSAARSKSYPPDADEKTRWAFLEGTWKQPRIYYVKFWKDFSGKMFVESGTPLMPLYTTQPFPTTEIKSITPNPQAPQSSIITMVDGTAVPVSVLGQLITWKGKQMRKQILGLF